MITAIMIWLIANEIFLAWRLCLLAPVQSNYGCPICGRTDWDCGKANCPNAGERYER